MLERISRKRASSLILIALSLAILVVSSLDYVFAPGTSGKVTISAPNAAGFPRYVGSDANFTIDVGSASSIWDEVNFGTPGLMVNNESGVVTLNSYTENGTRARVEITRWRYPTEVRLDVTADANIFSRTNLTNVARPDRVRYTIDSTVTVVDNSDFITSWTDFDTATSDAVLFDSANDIVAVKLNHTSGVILINPVWSPAFGTHTGIILVMIFVVGGFMFFLVRRRK